MLPLKNRPWKFLITFRVLCIQQILILRVSPDVLAHKPAHRPDLQSVSPGVVQARLDQFAAQAAISNGRWDSGMGEDDDIPFQQIIEHGFMAIDGHLETMTFGVMRDIVFNLHRFIFIPICDFVNPSLS